MYWSEWQAEPDLLEDLEAALQLAPVEGSEDALVLPVLIRDVRRFAGRVRGLAAEESERAGEQPGQQRAPHHAFSPGAAAAAAPSGAASAAVAAPFAAVFQHRLMDALRQLRGPLELADERHDDEEVREVVAGGDLADPDEVALGRVGADPAERDAVDHEDPERPLVDRAEARAADPGCVEPGQDEEDEDRGDHRHDAAELVGNRAQDRVEGQEVPFRHDVRRRLQRVRLLVVDHLAQRVRHVEGEDQQDEHHHADPERVLHRVVRVEGDGVLRALDVDAERVVGLAVMQRPRGG